MKKTVLISVLLVLVCLLAAACKSNKGDIEALASEPAVSTAPADTAEPTAEPAEESPTAEPTSAPEPSPVPIDPTYEAEAPEGYAVSGASFELTVMRYSFAEDGGKVQSPDRVCTVPGARIVPAEPAEEEAAYLEGILDAPYTANFEGTVYWGYYSPEEKYHGIKKYVDNELIWDKHYDFNIYTVIDCGEILVSKAIAYPDNYRWDTVIVLDPNGNILWQKYVFPDPMGSKCEIMQLLVEEDGTVAVFGRYGAAEDLLFFRRYSLATGELLASCDNEGCSAVMWLTEAVRIGGGYAAIYGKRYNFEQDYFCIVLFDNEGRVTDCVDFAMDGAEIMMTAAAEYNGLLYLSGRTVKESGDNELAELTEILCAKGANGKPVYESASRAEIGMMAREYYNAVLIAFDTEKFEPVSMLMMEYGSGSELGLSEGRLIWSACRDIVGEFMSTWQAYSMTGLVDEYTIDTDGSLISIVKTDRYARHATA